MQSTLPLDTLTDLARNRTDEAARALAILRNAKLTASQKLEQLLEYRHYYTEQLRVLMTAGVASAQLRNYHQFLAALDGGIEQQRAAARHADARMESGRSDWQQQHRRLNAYETLAERLQRQQQMEQGRREQRATDEQASRMVFGRLAAL